jgi:hypothetical protein
VSRRRAGKVVGIVVALGAPGSFALLTGCENDVAVQLLPPPPPEEPPCVDGDPCSGLAWALRFGGAYDRVEVPSSASLDLPQDFTLEAWVFISSYAGGHGVLNRWTAGVADVQLTFGVPEPLPQLELMLQEPVPSHTLASWGFVRAEYWITVHSTALPSAGAWHHIATSYGAGSYRLYVDGTLAASVDATDTIANAANTLYIGATARNERGYDGAQGELWWPPIDGFIGDVRLSSQHRYPADFVPEAHLTSDAATIALWHLEEGEGEQARDSGPHQLDGSIVGASWALAPRRELAPQL